MEAVVLGPIRKAVAFLAWMGQGAGLGWALHSAFFPRLLLTLWAPPENFWGRDNRVPPAPHSWAKPTTENPSSHTLSTPNHPTGRLSPQ